MHILLVNPAMSGTLRKVGVLPPPLGLLYVAAAVRQHGFGVEIFDEAVDRRHIEIRGYDVVGIHCDTTYFHRAMELAHLAKGLGAKVVMGGPHPCFDIETILFSGVVDAIVRGEGELTFVSLLQQWQKGDSITDIPGVITIENNQIIDGGPAQRIQDVDSLPMPARDLLDLSLYHNTQLGGRPLAPVHTSRGCPFQCRFCASTHIDGPVWRARSAKSVLTELDHLYFDLGYRAIAFMDDNFTGSKKRVMEICDGIIQKQMDILWWCFCRVDTILRHPDMITRMAEAGAFSVFVGVESPSAEVLDKSNKGIRADQAREAVEILKKNRIEVWASYILGFPQETRKDIRATIRFARQLDTHTAQFTLLTPYPGTALHAELKDRLLYKAGKAYDGVHAVYRHPQIPPFEMQLWHLWAYLSFYLRSWQSVCGFFRFLHNRIFRFKNINKELVKQKG